MSGHRAALSSALLLIIGQAILMAGFCFFFFPVLYANGFLVEETESSESRRNIIVVVSLIGGIFWTALTVWIGRGMIRAMADKKSAARPLAYAAVSQLLLMSGAGLMALSPVVATNVCVLAALALCYVVDRRAAPSRALTGS